MGEKRGHRRTLTAGPADHLLGLGPVDLVQPTGQLNRRNHDGSRDVSQKGTSVVSRKSATDRA